MDSNRSVNENNSLPIPPPPLCNILKLIIYRKFSNEIKWCLRIKPILVAVNKLRIFYIYKLINIFASIVIANLVLRYFNLIYIFINLEF